MLPDSSLTAGLPVFPLYSLSMNVLALQWNLAWEDRPANLALVERLLQTARPAPNTLIVLPEMFSTGFSMNRAATDEPDDGPTREFLASLARKYECAALGGRVCDGRNEALAVAPSGETLARYAKIKPFRPGGEDYGAGSEPVMFEWAGARICPFVCYDLRFPELFREAARWWKPEVFVVIASWPEARIDHWLALLRARAIENQAYVLGVNRTGTDPHHKHTGRTALFDHSGKPLADAKEAEAALAAPLDLDALRTYRKRLPFLEDLSPRT